jgi:hypothetical protein
MNSQTKKPAGAATPPPVRRFSQHNLKLIMYQLKTLQMYEEKQYNG